MIGMTMEENATLYIIEPYEEQKSRNPEKEVYTTNDFKSAGTNGHKLFALQRI